MIVRRATASGRIIRGTLSGPDFPLSLSTRSYEEVPAVDETLVDRDRTWRRQVTAINRRDGIIATDADVTVVPQSPYGVRKLDNVLQPTASANPGVTISDLYVRGERRHVAKISNKISIMISGGVETATFQSFAAGSLGEHCNAQVDDRLVGKALSDRAMFSVHNHGTSTYVRSPGWWSGLDVTAWTVWNNYWNDNRGCVTAINTRIVLGAKHQGIPNSKILRWVSAANEVVERTLVAQLQPVTLVINGVPTSNDIYLGLLDSPLPAAIKPMRILSAIGARPLLPTLCYSGSVYSDEKYFSRVAGFEAHSSLEGIPNGIPQLAPLDFYASATNLGASAFRGWFGVKSVAAGIRRDMSYGAVDGDSGRPAGLIINNELFLVGHTESGGNDASGGATAAGFVAELNAGIETLLPGGGQQIVPYTPAGFNSY